MNAGDGDHGGPPQDAIEVLQFEIATSEFNQQIFASQLPADFIFIKTAAINGLIPDFLVQDAAAHPVLRAAVQRLLDKQLGPIFREANESEICPKCESAYMEYTASVPDLLRNYVDATPSERAIQFGKDIIAPDMRIDETLLLHHFESGKICCDDLVEALSSPRCYKMVLKGNHS